MALDPEETEGMPEEPATPTALFDTLQGLATEQRNPRAGSIDTASVEEILHLINTEDHQVPIAVRREIPHIAQAVRFIGKAFEEGGRLLYVGAGTSGRLGVLDASECPPTFGTDPEMVQGLVAGGRAAVFRSQEGVEDEKAGGAEMLDVRRGRRTRARDRLPDAVRDLHAPRGV